jgi:protoporphyrin/coproporphyrin ferrochelatase
MSGESMSQRTAILLLAHGTPDKLSEMSEYLQKVTGGRPMPHEVVEELQHRYAQIGLTETKPGLGDDRLPVGPPLTHWTLLQARMLGELLGQPVYVGMRNWHPYIADVVAQMRADGVKHARVLCLAPQNSRTSTGLYRRALMAAVGESFTVDFIAGWADEPLLAQAFAERMWPAWAEACAITSAAAGKSVRVPILFTAHAVPCRTIMSSIPTAQPESHPGAPVHADGMQHYGTAQKPDPYPVECKHTAAAIAAALRPVGLTDDDWFFAFQSQGIAGAPWIGPTVPDTLKALADAGHKAVVLQPVGFLCDHVEILYDIDIDFKQQAAALGMQLSRAESLNASATLIRAIDSALRRAYTRLDPNTAPEPTRGRPAHTKA